MAKSRQIDTRLWRDSWTRKLSKDELLLFVYLLQSDSSDLCGVYEEPIDQIALGARCSVEFAEKTLKKFEENGKIRYDDGWVAIRNFVRYRSSINTPNIRKSIVSGFKSAPKHLVEWVNIEHDEIKAEVERYFKTKLRHKDDIPMSKQRHVPSPLPSPSPSPLLYSPNGEPPDKSVGDSESGLTTTSDESGNSSGGEESGASESFSLVDEIRKLEESPRRDLNIIALYFEMRKPQLENKEQFQIALRRHLRPAKMLIPFTDSQISFACKKASEWPEWTLDTVLKKLTK